MKKKAYIVSLIILPILVSLMPAYAADKAGEIVSLKGKSFIVRADKRLDAAVKDSLFLQDTVETDKSARMKILFADDSLLTLGEMSRVSVREYLTGDDKKRGQSVFRLLDGKVRTIVGKNAYEIHTPTAVAAARGTAFITWTGKIDDAEMKRLKAGNAVDPAEVAEALKGRYMTDNGIPVTCISLLKGIVDIRNIDPSVTGTEAVSEGNLCCVIQGMPPTRTSQTPKDLLTELMLMTGVEDSHGIERLEGIITTDELMVDIPVLPPIVQDPIVPSGIITEPPAPPEEQQR
ncbi:MAG: hypothetical protein FIA94_12545 [Nitrospirae bacterium]|nr:hypothetical protein [Nitrospirota bacterium]